MRRMLPFVSFYLLDHTGTKHIVRLLCRYSGIFVRQRLEDSDRGEETDCAVFSGTIFNEILLWLPFDSTKVLHRLRGHQVWTRCLENGVQLRADMGTVQVGLTPQYPRYPYYLLIESIRTSNSDNDFHFRESSSASRTTVTRIRSVQYPMIEAVGCGDFSYPISSSCPMIIRRLVISGSKDTSNLCTSYTVMKLGFGDRFSLIEMW